MLSLRHFSLATATLMSILVFPVAPTGIRLNLNASATPIDSTFGQLISLSLIDSSGQGSVLQDEQNQPENQKAEADRLFQEGIELYDRRKYQESLPKFQQVLAIRQLLRDKAGEAITLHKIGSVYFNLKKYQQALIFYQQALPIRREIGDKAGEAHTLNNIGAVYERLNDNERSRQFFDQANAIYQQIGLTRPLFQSSGELSLLRDDDDIQNTPNPSQPNTPKRVGNSSGEGSLLPDEGESAF